MNSPNVERISECFIKPKHELEQHKQRRLLSAWDLNLLCFHYIQKGLLFAKPLQEEGQQAFNTMDFLQKLQDSLSVALIHFYPLAGRLVTSKSQDPPSYFLLVDCSNSPGAGFIHARVDLTISDIVSPTYVPLVVQSFFEHNREVNHDGHTRPLLTIQVTELIDGVFIGCSLNHAVVDGTSYWHFLNTWSEIFRGKGDHISISRPPIMTPWSPEGYGPIINLPYTSHEQFVRPFDAPLLKERIFHFSAESIAKLKAKANAECGSTKISSFQSLSALVWRCITRHRHLPPDQITSCKLAVNNRHRLNPPVPEYYFGNCVNTLRALTTAGELLNNNLGWAAWLLHEAVVNHNDKKIQEDIETWLKSPAVYHLGQLFDPYSVLMGSSPRFDKYGSEFGLGKAITLRSGYANKFSGKASAYPGREGGGSIDLEICLYPDAMTGLESDHEFMDAVSL